MLTKDYIKKLRCRLLTMSTGSDGKFTIELINSDFSLPIIFKTLLDKYFDEKLIDKSAYTKMN